MMSRTGYPAGLCNWIIRKFLECWPSRRKVRREDGKVALHLLVCYFTSISLIHIFDFNIAEENVGLSKGLSLLRDERFQRPKPG